MRLRGIIKIASVMIVDFIIVYYLGGLEAAVLLTLGIALYAWLGEYIALLKDGAIKQSKLNDYDKSKLSRAFDYLKDDIKNYTGTNIDNLKLHIIPTENINAFAYGFNNVAVTKATLDLCDELTLCSILGHEISHILNMDAVFNRIIFANITILMAGLIMISFIMSSFIWIFFLFLCVCGICGGIVSALIVRGLNGIVKKIFLGLQYAVLFIYQSIIGIVSRSCEYRADKFSCQLGYGAQLSYFLKNYIGDVETGKKTINDILYASHPATYKRVQKIESYHSFR